MKLKDALLKFGSPSKNQHPYTGKEVLKKINNKIHVYIDEYGSYRVVFKNGKINISALQIVYDEKI